MKISVVIPCLNEEAHLENLLQSLGRYDFWEIIVVDGGSVDRSKDLAKRYTDKVISSQAGRGAQLNKGARKASGDALLFLHADSKIESDITCAIRQGLNTPGIAGGAFRLRIDSSRPGLKLISSVANLRSRLFGFAFGDQGIFVKREVFEKVGGFGDTPLMEDVDFVKRIKAYGGFLVMDDFICTSPRRWEREGVIFCTLRNSLILFLYNIGVPTITLKRWYRD